MKTVDIGRKNFDLISTSGSGTHDVIDISFVQGWFSSRVLRENLFLDMSHEQTSIIISSMVRCRKGVLSVKGRRRRLKLRIQALLTAMMYNNADYHGPFKLARFTFSF